MDPASASSSAIAKTENYLYFDPRSANARGIMVSTGSHARGVASGAAMGSMPGGLGGGGGGAGGGGTGSGTQATFGQRRQAFSEAIVFTVGGGSMDEYGNLQEWAKRTSGGGAGGAGGAASVIGSVGGAVTGPASGAARRRVVYGSTELMNASEFISEGLAPLGKESR